MSQFTSLYTKIQEKGYATAEEGQRLHELEIEERNEFMQAVQNGAVLDLIKGTSEHICEDNEMYGTAMESKIYKGGDKWYLSLDCGECVTEICYCPYCGEELEGSL
ncbi:MAG: hypothetical protein PHE79_05070 [Eubacteriales bacterium]|nr:hypothetical protein [Eubacteriales bacterium]